MKVANLFFFFFAAGGAGAPVAVEADSRGGGWPLRLHARVPYPYRMPVHARVLIDGMSLRAQPLGRVSVTADAQAVVHGLRVHGALGHAIFSEEQEARPMSIEEEDELLLLLMLTEVL